jgi:hypothetical protein
MEKNRPELEFTTSTNDILRILLDSKDRGNVIGIGSPALGAGIFMTAVDEVIEDYEIVICLKPYDINGKRLEKNILKLTDITTACAFRSQYDQLFHEEEVAEPAFEMGVYA